MGVMECQRAGCRNIGCRKVTFDNRYICDSCASRFKELMITSGWENESRGFFDEKMEEFMSTDVNDDEDLNPEKIDVDDYI